MHSSLSIVVPNIKNTHHFYKCMATLEMVQGMDTFAMNYWPEFGPVGAVILC